MYVCKSNFGRHMGMHSPNFIQHLSFSVTKSCPDLYLTKLIHLKCQGFLFCIFRLKMTHKITDTNVYDFCRV